MSDEVAKLGFEVDSKPLDDAKQKLSEVSTEAGKTGKAVDDFNQKVGKTGAEAAKAGDGLGKVGPALSTIEAAAKRAGVSVEEMRARTASFSAESGKLAASSATAATAIGSVAKEAAAVGPALGAVGAATAAVTAEHVAHNNALTGLRGNLRGMGPLLNQFGSGLGDLVQYSRAARLGLAGFAAVAGGAALLALEKLGDEIARTKNQFAGLTGSAEGGARAYDAIKAAAKSGGLEISALSGAVQQAIIGQEQFADKNVQYANTADMVAKKTEQVSAAFGTFGTIMQANSATAEQENRALKALGDSFEKTGTLTVDAFNKIRTESKSTGLALAQAFGFQNVKDFITELDKAPISLDAFVKRMAVVKPQVDATFDPDKPKTFEQALRGVTSAGNELLETLAKAGAFGFFKDLLTGTKKEVEALSTPLETLQRKFNEAGQESEKSWTELADVTSDKSKSIGKNIEDNVNSAVLKSLAILGRLPGEGIQSITEWANEAIAQFNRMAAGAVQAAQTAISALKQIGSAAASAIGSASAPGSPAEVGTMGSGGGSDGLEGIQLTPSGDAGTIDFGDLGGGGLPEFASGGQFTVGGTGGTDSQTVAFKSTPGEVVTVSTPEQIALQSTGAISGVTTQSDSTAVGVVSATPEPAAVASVKEITDAIDKSSIDITKKVLLGSEAIVTELKKLTGGVAASTINPATGLPIATKSSTMSGASGGGPSFTVKGGINPTEAQYAKDQAADKAFQAANAAAQGGYGGDPAYARGYGGFVQGSRKSGASSFATMAPTGQFANYNPNYSGSQSVYSPVSDYYGTADGFNGSISDVGGGMSDFYGTNYDGSEDFYGSLTDYGTAVPIGSGSVSGFDGGNSYYSDYGGSGISGFDPNAMNYGGGSVDAGYFASGGSFTVPGSGGTDTTLVTMHNTPGETVTVTPLAPNFATAANADPSSQANVTEKTVNIHVQAGIQAESFIRSRAQIARGL